jgi:hypothetical protein
MGDLFLSIRKRSLVFIAGASFIIAACSSGGSSSGGSSSGGGGSASVQGNANRQETVALTIGFRRLSVNGFFPSLTFQDEKQKSSIAIYQFKRNSMNLTFSRDF